MSDILGTNDMTKLRDTAPDLRLFNISLEKFRCIKASQSRSSKLDSELVLHELFFRLPDWLKRAFEAACHANGKYVPHYNALVAFIADV